MLVFVAPGREMPSYQKEKRCIVKSSPALKLLMNMCSNKLHSLFIENICSNKLQKLFMDVSNDQTCLVLDLPWEQKDFLGDYSLRLWKVSLSSFFIVVSLSSRDLPTPKSFLGPIYCDFSDWGLYLRRSVLSFTASIRLPRCLRCTH